MQIFNLKFYFGMFYSHYLRDKSYLGETKLNNTNEVNNGIE